MATRTRKRRYYDADIEDAVRQEARLGRTPAQIDAILSRDARFADRRTPDVRTIQRWVADVVMENDGDSWEIGEEDSASAAAVLAALREVIIYSNGERVSLSKEEARATARVAALAPDIPPLAHFLLAKRDGIDVQFFLAFAPWRGETEKSMYFRFAVPAGARIPVFPPMPTLVGPPPRDFWQAVTALWLEKSVWSQVLSGPREGGDDDTQS